MLYSSTKSCVYFCKRHQVIHDYYIVWIIFFLLRSKRQKNVRIVAKRLHTYYARVKISKKKQNTFSHQGNAAKYTYKKYLRPGCREKKNPNCFRPLNHRNSIFPTPTKLYRHISGLYCCFSRKISLRFIKAKQSHQVVENYRV